MNEEFIQNLKENQREGSFCMYPFMWMRNSPMSGYTPCCWFHPNETENPENTLPFDWFDGPKAVDFRKQMLSNEKTLYVHRSCKNCLKWEREGAESPRLMTGFHEHLLSMFNEEGEYLGEGRHMTLELNIYGDYCNLECYACKPFDSNTRRKRVDQLVQLDSSYAESLVDWHYPSDDLIKVNSKQFYDVIQNIVDNIHRVKCISFCGGEPMAMKSHFQVLDAVIATGQSKEIDICYTSNMTMFRLSKMQKYIDAFKWTAVEWSCDGLYDRNYYLRYPTDWDTVVSNVLDLQMYFDLNKNGQVGATYTPSLLSIYKIKEVFDFFESSGLQKKPFKIFNKISDPKMLMPNHLPDEIKQEIAEDVKSVSESVYTDLMRPRNEKLFQEALKYFDDLDKLRGTDWRSTFPELAKY